MNKIFSTLSRLLLAITITSAFSMATTSCESILEDGGDCPYFVKFEYTKHLEFGDVFSAQVKSVDLWIFDKHTGQLVDHVSESGEALAQNDYRMQLHVGPGEYTFVAWCGDENNRHFTINSNINKLEDVTCKLNRTYDEDGRAMSDECLDLLFHGIEAATLPNWETLSFDAWVDNAEVCDTKGDLNTLPNNNLNRTNTKISRNALTDKLECVVTIPLTRDTNDLSLSLTYLGNDTQFTRFNLEQLRVELIDNNGSMYHNNELDESDENIVYKPWRLVSGTADVQKSERSREDYIYDPDAKYSNFVHTELTSARLMANHETTIRVYYKDTDQTIFQIPFTQWVKLLRSAKYKNMSDQEYLDRENAYNLQVYIQDDNRTGYVAVEVVINSWKIIENGDVNVQ